jgi:ABC-type multidrug transport system ATPase subunit
VKEPALRVEDVHKRYGSKRVLLGTSFDARAGQLVAIVGENGSGKSTLLRILAGVEAADRGRVVRDGACGYCPQEPLLYPYLTPDEHFELFACAYGLSAQLARARGEALLDRFGLGGHRRTVVQELSGGTRQKVNLAIALMHDPPHVLLDEPYSGLDLEAYRRFTGWVKEARADGKCIVLIAHMLFERDPFDVVLHLEGGRVRVDAA